LDLTWNKVVLLPLSKTLNYGNEGSVVLVETYTNRSVE
jgi:hypothetical protein